MIGDSEKARLREEELQLFREWKTAKTKRRRDAALLELCRRSKPALHKALEYLIAKYNASREIPATRRMWLERHSLGDEDLTNLGVLAVLEAGETFDPGRASGNNRFTTYAYSFIVDKLYAAASVKDCANHTNDVVGGQIEEVLSEEGNPCTTWKRVASGHRPVLGGSTQLVEEDPTDRRLRFLFGLNSDDGGFGKVSTRGEFLNKLDDGSLIQLKDWLEENHQRATELFGQNSLPSLYFLVRWSAFVRELPPEERTRDMFEGMSSVGPFQGVTLRVDGKKWDQMLPVQADILLRAGLTKSAVAKQLDLAWSTFKDMHKRMVDVGFDSGGFTPDQADASVRGQQGRRKPQRPKT